MDDVTFSDFTNEEKERLDVLYGTDFTGELTPDDVALIARWERCKALQNEKFKAETEAMREVTTQRLELAREISDTAMMNLEELKNAALARLERLNDGI